MAKEMNYKLLFINQTLDVGGAEVFHTDLLSALQKQSVSVSAHVTEPRYLRMLQDRKIRSEKIPVILDLVGNWKGLVKGIIFFPRALIYYRNLVAQHKDSDLILLSSFTEKFFVSPLAAKYKIPVVWIEFGPVHPLLKKFYGLPGLLYAAVSSIPKVVIVPSQNTFRELAQHHNIAAEKMLVIPCGRAITDEEVRELQKISVQPHSIICVSRLEEGKGQDLLLAAFKLVKQKYQDAALFITGESSWSTALKKLAEKLEIAPSVTFLGRVPSSLEWMSKCQVCVFPSVWELEGFGLVMIEAMALGKPIVAFHVGPAPEIIVADQNGFLAEKGNVQDLAKQLMLALENSPKNKKLGQQAEKDFFERYQIEKVATLYNNCFIHIMSNSKKYDK